MKLVFIVTFFINLLISPSCSPKKQTEKEASQNLASQKTEKKISINYFGSLEFNRSYSFLQDPALSKKEKNRLSDEMDKSNPVLVVDDQNDTVVLPKFEGFGIVKGYELLLDKIKFDERREFSITTQSKKLIKILIHKDTTNEFNSKIIVHYDNDTAEVKADTYFRIQFKLLDMVPGGHKEIVILNEHYLANTYVYNLDVYEIKTKD